MKVCRRRKRKINFPQFIRFLLRHFMVYHFFSLYTWFSLIFEWILCGVPFLRLRLAPFNHSYVVSLRTTVENRKTGGFSCFAYSTLDCCCCLSSSCFPSRIDLLLVIFFLFVFTSTQHSLTEVSSFRLIIKVSRNEHELPRCRLTRGELAHIFGKTFIFWLFSVTTLLCFSHLIFECCLLQNFAFSMSKFKLED